jgi:hypothetical protein
VSSVIGKAPLNFLSSDIAEALGDFFALSALD